MPLGIVASRPRPFARPSTGASGTRRNGLPSHVGWACLPAAIGAASLRRVVVPTRLACSSAAARIAPARIPSGWGAEGKAWSPRGIPPLKAGGAPASQGEEEEYIIPPELEKKSIFWKYLTFTMIFFGYCIYYFTRGSFTYVSIPMQQDLGFTLQEIGRITTVFPLMYGFSKFASGILADSLGARTIFSMGLVASSLINLSFAQHSNITTLTALWAANGFFQGFGGPACARILTQWYPAKERGKWWSLWSAAHNVGGLAIPLLAGGVAQAVGWRFGMIVPGMIGLVTGAIVMVGLRDSPTDVGLPALPKPKVAPRAGAVVGEEDKLSAVDVVLKYVLTSRCMWALAVSYFFVYVVRQGLVSWSLFYLTSVKGVPTAAKAAAIGAMLELGGLGGSIASGAISDGLGGHRIRVTIAFMVGTAASICLLPLVPAGDIGMLTAVITLIGFFIYGPQMLIGLIGAEVSHPLGVASGNGLLGWIAYIGAAVAGEPLAVLVKQHGWAPFFTALTCCCAVPALLLLPYWNVRRYEDLQKKT